MNFLCKYSIHHVDKQDDAANLSEVRLLEDFWCISKAKVYENNQKQIIFIRSGSSYNIENDWGFTKKNLNDILMFNIIENRKYKITKKILFFIFFTDLNYR